MWLALLYLAAGWVLFPFWLITWPVRRLLR